MSDDRPSIAELQRNVLLYGVHRLRDAAPALLEIAAAAVACSEAQLGGDARSCDLAYQHLHRLVTSKVRR